jgi:alkanesulfonate monooxygenase SsuD/methylene tetrahydromethanopterin reductase-like flavin-dependent oxidoreductase (luciferase family)
VGVGGSCPDEWLAAGVPLAERGARTDRALAALPKLLSGQPTTLSDQPGAPAVTLTPAVTPPPIWIGGGSQRALRRVVGYGDGWLAAMTPPDEIRGQVARLRALAGEHRRATPSVGAVLIAAPADRAAAATGFLTARLGMSADRAARTAVTGDAAGIAEKLCGYAEAGAGHLVLAPFGPDWRAQFELFADARRLALAARPADPATAAG